MDSVLMNVMGEWPFGFGMEMNGVVCRRRYRLIAHIPQSATRPVEIIPPKIKRSTRTITTNSTTIIPKMAPYYCQKNRQVVGGSHRMARRGPHPRGSCRGSCTQRRGSGESEEPSWWIKGPKGYSGIMVSNRKRQKEGMQTEER